MLGGRWNVFKGFARSKCTKLHSDHRMLSSHSVAIATPRSFGSSLNK